MKVVVVTPAGRQNFLEILFENLLKNKKDFDQWCIWLNTTTLTDIEYCLWLQTQYSWIKIIPRPIFAQTGLNCVNYTYLFWQYCYDPDTIYIRLDDDIVYLDKQFVKIFADFIYNHPKYIVCFGNINNNGIISHMHQRFEAFNLKEKLEYRPFNQIMSSNITLFEKVHYAFIENILQNKKEKYLFYKHVIFPNFNTDVGPIGERVFSNAVGWLGQNFKKHNVKVEWDEEEYINHWLPLQTNMPIAICGQALCSHFSFSKQRTSDTYHRQNKILEEYKKISFK